ncbi:MAG: sigma-70 family RNA polymerase sigma factor [Cellvibrionaceae bacterium]|nr:sigma-70 family RNA polymerase sigma factor [Cellvibrionaceae bacterium]
MLVMFSPSSSSSTESLYRDHHSWLYCLLRRKLGNAADAADLAQDAFVRLIIKPRLFDTSSGARAYLSVMAKGLCIDLWRRREIEQAWLETLAESAGDAPCVEDQAMVLETLFQIDAMLGRMPRNVSAAFVMSMIYGYSGAEIAQHLGVSDRMVRKYLSTAMLHCLEGELREQVQ